MDEDLELNRFVKDALESGGSFRLRRPARRMLAPWLGGALLAASVASVVSFRHGAVPSEACVAEAICLLSEADGIALDADGEGSPVELLQAWQAAGIGW